MLPLRMMYRVCDLIRLKKKWLKGHSGSRSMFVVGFVPQACPSPVFPARTVGGGKCGYRNREPDVYRLGIGPSFSRLQEFELDPRLPSASISLWGLAGPVT